MSEQIQIQFLEKSLSTTHQLRTAFDNKANFLMGISSVLAVLSLSQYQKTAFLILGTFSLITVIFCVCAISLPFRRLSKESVENIFCWWGVKGKTYEEYSKNIGEKIAEPKDLIREYSKEIYSLYYDSIRYKIVLLRIASLSLFAGFVIVFISLFF